MVMFVIDRKMRQKEDFENVGRQFTLVFVSSAAVNVISMAFWFTTNNDFPGSAFIQRTNYDYSRAVLSATLLLS